MKKLYILYCTTNSKVDINIKLHILMVINGVKEYFYLEAKF